jgi:hypothetical protein
VETSSLKFLLIASIYFLYQEQLEKGGVCTECPTRYRTRHFFNNSNTNEDIAMKFEQEYVRCVRNEEECACSVCLIVATWGSSGKIIKEMPGSVASGTPCTCIDTIC